MGLVFLAAALLAPLTKHLVKLAFGEGIETEIGNEAVNWLTGRPGDYEEADKAEFSVRKIARQTLRELSPLFKQSPLSSDEQRNVADALGRTLKEVDVAERVIAVRFDPKALLTALETGRPAARG